MTHKELCRVHRQLVTLKFARKDRVLLKKERMRLSRVRQQIDRVEMRDARKGFEMMNRMVRRMEAMERIVRKMIVAVESMTERTRKLNDELEASLT